MVTLYDKKSTMTQFTLSEKACCTTWHSYRKLNTNIPEYPVIRFGCYVCVTSGSLIKQVFLHTTIRIVDTFSYNIYSGFQYLGAFQSLRGYFLQKFPCAYDRYSSIPWDPEDFSNSLVALRLFSIIVLKSSSFCLRNLNHDEDRSERVPERFSHHSYW